MVTPPAIDIPAMVTQQEKNYYYWLASNHAPGVGAVVEFGTWLGASTAHLAAGLNGRTIHCFDWFRWSSHYNPKSDVHLEDGADFTQLFLDNMSRFGANVVAHQARLKDVAWDGGPVELLVLDAPKQATDLARLLKVFAPSFIPGQTRIAIQDYQHFPAYQISVIMDAIRFSVALEHVVVSVNSNLQPNTAAFLVTDVIETEALIEAASSFKTWSAERIHATWSRIIEPLPEQARARLAPGLALFLYDAGHEDEALAALAAMPMDRIMTKRWKRMAGLHISARYPLLFASMEQPQAATE